jgi:hypothetical protein
MPLSQVIGRKPQWFRFTDVAIDGWSQATDTSVVCQQVEHIIASYLRKIWGKEDLLFDGQHGFRLRYSCDNQVITVCQDIADSLDDGNRIAAIIIDYSKALNLVPYDRLHRE